MASEVLSLWRETEGASGREAELSALLRELDEAKSAARARFAFVRGPAGVGKSHLFGLLRNAVNGRGGTVFEAESPREAKKPFGLFANLLTEVIDHLSHAGVSQAALSELAHRLAPILEGKAAPGQLREDRRLELYDAVGELLLLSARSQPLFLFPDLDAADHASIELFRYLAAVVSSPESDAQGLFVGSFRDGEASKALSEVLQKVSARTVALSGLDLEGIRTFLARREVAQKLFDATGGIPDALHELLTRPSAQPVDFFLKRAEGFSAPQRALLSALSVSREPLALDVLEAASRVQDSARELDALVRQHVIAVRVSNGRPVYRFSRDGEKAAFAQTLSSLSEVKQRLAKALLEGGDLSSAAELLLEVDGSGEGFKVATQAADGLAQRGAFEAARELYLRALPVTPKAQRPALHAKLSELAAVQGDFRQALRHLARSRGFGQERKSSQERARYAEAAARYLVRLGKLSLAQRLCTVALQDAAVAPKVAVTATELAVLQGQPDRALSIAEGALRDERLSTEQRIALRHALGKAHLYKSNYDAARLAFEQNLEAARKDGLKTLAAQALLNQGVVAARTGDRARAMACYDAGLKDAQRPAHAQALANLGSIYAESGDFDQALEHLSRALQAFSRLSASREVAHAASNLARLNLFLGDLDRAVELSEHSLSVAREIGEPYLEASALLNLGAALIDRREAHDALKLLDEARTRFEELGNDGYAALASAMKARAHLSLGERAQASVELQRKNADKGAAQLPDAAVELELARAELSLLLGDLLNAGRAATRARDALLSHPDLEGPYRVYFLMGRLRLAAGDTSGAQAEMARSARLLDELTQRVPAPRRNAFLSVPRRAEVLSSVEPELRLPRLAAALKPASDERSEIGLVGGSASLGRIVKQIEPIARSNATVLVRGESGTGKELLAAAIHALSPRKAMPLIKVNCAAMVEELLLSELFGHEKGAFTGAIRERKGRFELADGGTLFLDEIGDISPKAQVALLRALQEREFERVGGTKTIKVDVRVICATNRDLEALIAQGRFRQDLYYRLKGVMLELPSLRERLEDLPILAGHFLGRVSKERNEAQKQLSQEALELLGRHTWPGNVRELENVLASAAIFADGNVITPEAFEHVAELAALMAERRPEETKPSKVVSAVPLAPVQPVPQVAPVPAPVVAVSPSVATAAAQLQSAVANDGSIDFYSAIRNRGVSLKDLRHELEMQCIKRALEDAAGNISEAARLLKMKRSRLSQIVNGEPELKSVARGDLSEVGDD